MSGHRDNISLLVVSIILTSNTLFFLHSYNERFACCKSTTVVESIDTPAAPTEVKDETKTEVSETEAAPVVEEEEAEKTSEQEAYNCCGVY